MALPTLRWTLLLLHLVRLALVLYQDGKARSCLEGCFLGAELLRNTRPFVPIQPERYFCCLPDALAATPGWPYGGKLGSARVRGSRRAGL